MGFSISICFVLYLRNMKFTLFFCCLLICNLTWSQDIVVIDPGHGGHDSGAVGYNGVLEKDITLAISLKLRSKLNKLRPNLKTVLTREKDIFIPIKGKDLRSKISNTVNASVFISIHLNATKAFSGRGTSIYISNTTKHRKNKKKATVLAYVIQSALVKNLGFKNQGIFYENLSVLRNTIKETPSILIELGYVSNKDELNFILGKGSDLITNEMANAIVDFLDSQKSQK